MFALETYSRDSFSSSSHRSGSLCNPRVIRKASTCSFRGLYSSCRRRVDSRSLLRSFSDCLIVFSIWNRSMVLKNPSFNSSFSKRLHQKEEIFLTQVGRNRRQCSSKTKSKDIRRMKTGLGRSNSKWHMRCIFIKERCTQPVCPSDQH